MLINVWSKLVAVLFFLFLFFFFTQSSNRPNSRDVYMAAIFSLFHLMAPINSLLNVCSTQKMYFANLTKSRYNFDSFTLDSCCHFLFDNLRKKCSQLNSQIFHVLKSLAEKEKKNLWHTSVPAIAHWLKIVIIRHIKCW